MYVYDPKWLTVKRGRGSGEKRGIKNAGNSYDVIENTWRKNVSLGHSYDVHENTQLIFVYLRYS
jgi:hypothetical protein